jgi:topoisomerase IA-like protein
VVVAHPAERAWTVMDRGMPYVPCDTDGTPVTPEQAKQIIAERYTVPEQVRRRRRSRKQAGKALTKSCKDMQALKAQRGDPPRPASLGRQRPNIKPVQQPA